MNNTQNSYQGFKKPKWAPPSWLFGPVWSVLYLIITISFGTVIYKAITGSLSFIVVLPFILNLFFNAIYTPIQFSLKNFRLALFDILLVLITLIWLQYTIYPLIRWVALVNIPYVLWVCFATVLQFFVTYLNRRK